MYSTGVLFSYLRLNIVMFLANENFPRPSTLILRNNGFLVKSIQEEYQGISDENHDLFSFIYWPTGERHTWVCDGLNQMLIQDYEIYTYYDNKGNIIKKFKLYIDNPHAVLGFLHMNWGWGGYGALNDNELSNNGWYNYSINYSQANSTSFNFQYFQTVIYNIHS